MISFAFTAKLYKLILYQENVAVNGASATHIICPDRIFCNRTNLLKPLLSDLVNELGTEYGFPGRTNTRIDCVNQRHRETTVILAHTCNLYAQKVYLSLFNSNSLDVQMILDWRTPIIYFLVGEVIHIRYFYHEKAYWRVITIKNIQYLYINMM
jgi:hypothetical protein